MPPFRPSRLDPRARRRRAARAHRLRDDVLPARDKPRSRHRGRGHRRRARGHEASAAPNGRGPDAPGAARPPGRRRRPLPQPLPPRPGAPGQKPFADVVKDAKEYDGLLKLYQKDERVWIESARPARQADLLQVEHQPGHRRGRIFGGAMNYPMGVAQVVVFHKVGQNIQLIAKNTKYTAKPGTPRRAPSRRASRTACSATAPIAAQPHPSRKSYSSRRRTRCCSPTCPAPPRSSSARTPAVRLRRAQLVVRQGHGAGDNVTLGSERALRAFAPRAAAAAAR
jgi:hypothetical protein